MRLLTYFRATEIATQRAINATRDYEECYRQMDVLRDGLIKRMDERDVYFAEWKVERKVALKWAGMSTKERTEAVMALQGAWADRDDLDDKWLEEAEAK